MVVFLVFLKDAWEVISDDACAAILDCSYCGKLLKQVNNTLLVLIPMNIYS